MLNYPFAKKRCFKKTVMITRLTAILLFAACLQVSATGFPQKITLSQNKVSLKKVLAIPAVAGLRASPEKIITGTVKDQLGNPLAGVSVIIQGTGK